MDNLLNQSLDGRYLIEQQLGAGGMANVYRGKDLTTGRPVAVKVLRTEFLNNADLVRRFKNEAKAISVLNHPNITKVYDVSVSEQMQYIVMEYIDGITLKEYMEYRARPLTYKETLHFILQVLAALQHAHEKGIVHRDIKPQNIMLLADGTIKVMDFGIARMSRSENHTMTDKAIGSVHYISPEQAKGDVTDPRADIYSVGVMMYEMLSGHLPFESDSPVSVAIKQISETPTPLRELNPAVPEALAAITDRAMAKEPRDRYPSAREMMADLEEFARNPSTRPAARVPAPVPAVEEPTRYVDKVVSKTANKSSGASRNSRGGAPRKPAAPRPGGQAAARKKPQERNLMLPILAGVATAFALGAVILVFTIFKTSGSDLFAKHADVELPNFTNMTLTDAKNNPSYKQFDIKVEEVYNSEEEAGVIFTQSPKPPKTVKEGSTITLRVSKGSKNVKVPNLISKDRTEATKLLSQEDLMFKIQMEVIEDEASNGKVLRTDPPAGTECSTGIKGDVVTLYIGRVEKDISVKVPSVLGLLEEDAKKVLTAAKLQLGTVTQMESTEPAGTVIEQSPMYNENANMQSRVNVKVSTGIVTKNATVVVTAANPNDGHVWSINVNGDVRNMASSQGSASFTFSGTGQVIVSVSDEGGGNAQAQTLDFDAGVTVSFTVGTAEAPPPASDPTTPTDPTVPTDPVVPPNEGQEVMP